MKKIRFTLIVFCFLGGMAKAQAINDCIGVEKTRIFITLKNQRCIRVTWCDGHKIDGCFTDISMQILSTELNVIIESNETGTATVLLAFYCTEHNKREKETHRYWRTYKKDINHAHIMNMRGIVDREKELKAAKRVYYQLN